VAERPEFLDFRVGADGRDAVLGALSWPGRIGAPTVVAIPGGVNTAWSFDPLAHHLAGAARVVAVDLRGRGRSLDAPSAAGIARHADDVAEIVGQLGVGPVFVVGHSMGAVVALMTAERHPAVVRDLLLVDGGTPSGHEVDDPADLDTVVDSVVTPLVHEARTIWPDRVSYQSWRAQQPGFAEGIGPDLERNLLNDLVPVEDGFRLAVDPDAVLADGRDLLSNPEVATLLERRTTPTTIIRADPGPDTDTAAEPVISDAQRERFAQHRWIDTTGLDHLTVLLTPTGAALVADTIRSMIGDG
jgi:pimeloyl-ACP methyl ester carboxylesterase